MLQPSATADGSDTRAEVAKLADALDLGSSVERRAGSIPVLGTKNSWQRSMASDQKLAADKHFETEMSFFSRTTDH